MRKWQVGVSVFLSVSLATLAYANAAPMRIADVRFTDLGDPTQIEIVGTQFDQGGAVEVTVDGLPVSVIDSTATATEAELSGGITNGGHAIAVSTGDGAKQNAEHTLTVSALESMSVSCVDWFITAGHGEHIHNELHVEDEFGMAVLGADVVYTTAYRTFDDRAAGVPPTVFQTNLTSTTNTAGHNRGGGSSDPSGSGVTGWFCCIGAGKFDAGGEVPDLRSCPTGEYSYEILSVDSPEGTPLVWDGETPGPVSIVFTY